MILAIIMLMMVMVLTMVIFDECVDGLGDGRVGDEDVDNVAVGGLVDYLGDGHVGDDDVEVATIINMIAPRPPNTTSIEYSST